MDSALFVRHCLNLTITIHKLFRGGQRFHVTFWEHFFRLVLHRPKPAIGALYWHLTRRRVRARNRLRVASADLPFAYAVWIDQNEQTGDLASQTVASFDGWSSLPRFTVIVHSGEGVSKKHVECSITSVENQNYPHWELINAPVDWVDTGLARTSCDFVIPLRAGDALSPTCLFRFAEVLQSNADATVLYGDEDYLDHRGRRSRPWFKPRWNEELFLSQDYISSASAIRSSVATKVAANGATDLSSLLIGATSIAKNIIHVPHIMVHVRKETEDQKNRLKAVTKHLEPKAASCIPGPYGTIKVRWPLPEKLPLVSVIIPTKDKVEILRACVESLLDKTDYPNLEILIIDNDSVEQVTSEFLATISQNPKVRIFSYKQPFNYSAINNFAVSLARGTYLCLLNNDTEIIQSDWLTEIMRYAARPDIGAVGPMLLYDDKTIQHAGVVVGIGEAAGHAHRFLPSDQPGYFRMAHVSQFISAVTGACLVVEKAKFEKVGGFDEENLAIAFNDVDLCLKLELTGLRNVYVPHAVLIHHESKSRGNDLAPAHIDRYRRELKVLQERWHTKSYVDPLHNPNLDRYSETFVFRV